MFNALMNQNYLETILEHVNPLYFKDKNIQIVFNILKSFYIENSSVPNLTELKAHLVTKEQKDALKETWMSFNVIDKFDYCWP